MVYQKYFQLVLIFLALAPLTSLCFTLPSEYSIVGNDLNELLSEERVKELFQAWKEKHRKVYRQAEEGEKRLENFRRNLKFVVEKNGVKIGHSVGLNRFADLSNEEFRQRYLSKVKKPLKTYGNVVTSRQRNMQNCAAPSTLDWRNKGVVTPVKNQGDCGNYLFFLLL